MPILNDDLKLWGIKHMKEIKLLLDAFIVIILLSLMSSMNQPILVLLSKN